MRYRSNFLTVRDKNQNTQKDTFYKKSRKLRYAEIFQTIGATERSSFKDKDIFKHLICISLLPFLFFVNKFFSLLTIIDDDSSSLTDCLSFFFFFHRFSYFYIYKNVISLSLRDFHFYKIGGRGVYFQYIEPCV